MVKIKEFRLSESKAFRKTRYQNFFNNDGGKCIKTKQF